MRLIPVIDLLDDQAVHAVRGERDHYRPVQSVLCDTPNPAELARAFRDRLGLKELYIADLNAIQGFGRYTHRNLIAALNRAEGMDIILDAGIPDTETAQEWLDLGVRKVVVGSETLRTMEDLNRIPGTIGQDSIAFSLDLKGESVISQCAELAAMAPEEAIRQLQLSGWRNVILLDLNRVGSGAGAGFALASEARAKFPEVRLFVGGGLSRPDELGRLETLGVEGVLVATAFHRGLIGREDLLRAGGQSGTGRTVLHPKR